MRMNGAPHSTAAGPSLNGRTNTAVFISHYWVVPFNRGYIHLPSPPNGGPFRNYNVDVFFFEDITLGEMWKQLSCKILPKLHIHVQINNCVSHTKGVVLRCSNSSHSSIVILS